MTRWLHRSRWEPGPEVRVVRTHYSDLCKSLLRRVLKRAGLPTDYVCAA